jgi:predicted alpha/beta hydrolase family esterase
MEREKGIDVKLATDIIVASFDNKYDTAIIVSSDTDLIPAMDVVRHKNKKKIEYVGFSIPYKNKNGEEDSTKPQSAMIRHSDIQRVLVESDLKKFVKKRAIVVHCWEGYPEYCWYPYAKSKLVERDFSVEVPAFPDTKNPKTNEWLKTLKDTVENPSEDLYLIGHSLGCITIMKYLETLGEDQKIGGVIFVAGFTEDLGYKETKTFFETVVDLDKIKNKVKNGFIAIHSDDDPYVDLKYADIFKEKLGAEIITKHNAKHFSGARGEDGACLKFPVIIESIERLSNNIVSDTVG